jgi:hypothetical protein
MKPDINQKWANYTAGKKTLIIALMAVPSILFAGGLSWMYFSNEDSDKKVTSTSKKTGSSSDSKVKITAPVTKRENCGSQDCFEQKFKTCSKATLDAKSPIGSVHYEIYGPKDSGCHMLFKYTENPNPAWVDKDMKCIFDNTQGLEVAIIAAFNNPPAFSCKGPLVSIMQS